MTNVDPPADYAPYSVLRRAEFYSETYPCCPLCSSPPANPAPVADLNFCPNEDCPVFSSWTAGA